MTTPITRLHAAMLAIALTLPALAYAGMYQWRDANGKVHFSDQPPAGTVQAEQKALPSAQRLNAGEASGAEAAPTQSDTTRMENTKKLLDAMDRDRAIAAQQKQEKAEQEAKQKKACGRMRDLAQTAPGRRMYDFDDEGKKRYLGDQEREQTLHDTDAYLKANCK